MVSNNPNNEEIVKRLIARGALPTIPDSNGDTAFELATPEMQAVIQQAMQQLQQPAPLTFAAPSAMSPPQQLPTPHPSAAVLAQDSNLRVATKDDKKEIKGQKDHLNPNV